MQRDEHDGHRPYPPTSPSTATRQRRGTTPAKAIKAIKAMDAPTVDVTQSTIPEQSGILKASTGKDLKPRRRRQHASTIGTIHPNAAHAGVSGGSSPITPATCTSHYRPTSFHNGRELLFAGARWVFS
ncbi:hypothetical protein I6A84_04550 [Frankia sp. CNm7]|uniref:Uncharacterized protein n=1 Tax=Frankia nepalensis TaxID=1836974 RepID=A0A937R9A0_9ACTN|nr:hypothetical protein [Frankia nepalensis]MBL7498726.1 hypothetical protein [Frankia nepalensis]MBL7508409.1 hypothetical protein [Frankia nepalensis]MBL7517409.1 hypothetical protein [Frankia nepalensis]MBL7626240.1 hypothetical protein [Frankia nepalensis]